MWNQETCWKSQNHTPPAALPGLSVQYRTLQETCQKRLVKVPEVVVKVKTKALALRSRIRLVVNLFNRFHPHLLQKHLNMNYFYSII